MSTIDEILKNAGREINGLTIKQGRGKNAATEYTFLTYGNDSDSIWAAIQGLLEGTSLRLTAVVNISGDTYECTVLGTADPRG